jgi:thiol:disulfide interchange protein DsbD
MRYLFFILAVIQLNNVYGQASPVKWSFELKNAGSGKAEFLALAEISKGWNIYSVYMDEGGPVPTSFTFEELEKAKLEGKIIEKSEKITSFDNLFEMDVIKFKEKAEFSQFLVAAEGNVKLTGHVFFMCCDSQRCLPPTKVPFDLKL